MARKIDTASTVKLLAGRACLDFVNTVDWRASDAPVELLGTYGDLLAWSRHAGLLPSSEAAALRREAKRRPVVAAEVLMRARALREAIHALATGSAGRGGRAGNTQHRACPRPGAEPGGAGPGRVRLGGGARPAACRPGAVAGRLVRGQPAHGRRGATGQAVRGAGLRLGVPRRERPAALVRHGGLRQPRQGPPPLRARQGRGRVSGRRGGIGCRGARGGLPTGHVGVAVAWNRAKKQAKVLRSVKV